MMSQSPSRAEPVEPAAPSSRRRWLALAAAAVVVIVVVAVAVTRQAGDAPSTAAAAPTPSEQVAEPTSPPPIAAVELTGPAPEQKDLEGIWTLDDGRELLRLSADGTFVEFGGFDETARVTGIYDLDGRTLTLVSDGENLCLEGTRLVWETELLDDGHLHSVSTLDECLPGGDLPDWTWTRVSPNSRFAGTPTQRSADAEVPADVVPLQGIWLLEGGSVLFQVSPDGTFAWDDRGRLDTAPVDVGTVVLDGSTLTLTSGAESASCSEGDTLVLTDVAVTRGLPGDKWLYGTVDSSTCADITGPVSFLRLL